jgi:hypothetical protein
MPVAGFQMFQYTRASGEQIVFYIERFIQLQALAGVKWIVVCKLRDYSALGAALYFSSELKNLIWAIIETECFVHEQVAIHGDSIC